MRLLDALVFHVGLAPKRLELCEGDLAAMDDRDPVDVLVVSAFPNDYTPTPTSLIGALHRSGVSVADLARGERHDLRAYWSSWLSAPVAKGHGFSRILCFEPSHHGTPAEHVNGIFLALAPFMSVRPPVRSVAMPMVATGDQNALVSEIAPAQLDAAYHALRTTSLERVRIVLRAPEMVESVPKIFGEFRNKHLGTVVYGPLPPEHDVFISYSQRHPADADLVQRVLEDLRPGIRIYRDRTSLRAGHEYREQLDLAMRKSARVATLYSPEYLDSDPCKVEFNTAWNLRRAGARDLLYPMFIRQVGLDGAQIGPKLDGDERKKELHWDECWEAESEKVEQACRKLVATLPAPA